MDVITRGLSTLRGVNDMVKDPHETKNLYDDPKHAKVVSSLKQWFAKLRNGG